MNNVEELIKKYEIPVVKIDGNRNYWLIRTQAGEYHDEFYFDNFIAIGWNEFNEGYLFEGPSNEEPMKREIEKAYPESKQPGLIYNQIRRFFAEIRIGDVVMIPTQNSSHISFGIIESDPYIEKISDSDIEEGACPFQKRRKVKWIKTVKRTELDPYLYKMMHSHHTINNANDYAHFIDRTLHNFYMKNGRAYLVIPVKKPGKIHALDLFDFVNNVVELIPEINNLNLVKEKFEKRKDLDLKLNVQSPGIAEFSSAAPLVIFGIGVLLVFLVGGKITAKFTKDEKNIEASSEGLMSLIYKFKQQKSEHELKKLEMEHKQSMERINAQIPEEIKNLPNKLDQED